MFGIFRKKSLGQANPSFSIQGVEKHLQAMGYTLLQHGAGVALLELKSGYSEVDIASHIALTTLALDVRESGSDIMKLTDLHSHGMTVLQVLKSYKDRGAMNPTQWQNDSNAVFNIITVNERQKEWVAKVLSDPVAGKERLAKRSIR